MEKHNRASGAPEPVKGGPGALQALARAHHFDEPHAELVVDDDDFALGNTSDITTNDIAAYIDERLIKETVTGTGKVKAWADDPFDNSPSEGWEWRGIVLGESK